eukprot:1340701-Amorphochlora_amoeboformis.AAC.1
MLKTACVSRLVECIEGKPHFRTQAVFQEIRRLLDNLEASQTPSKAPWKELGETLAAEVSREMKNPNSNSANEDTLHRISKAIVAMYGPPPREPKGNADDAKDRNHGDAGADSKRKGALSRNESMYSVVGAVCEAVERGLDDDDTDGARVPVLLSALCSIGTAGSLTLIDTKMASRLDSLASVCISRAMESPTNPHSPIMVEKAAFLSKTLPLSPNHVALSSLPVKLVKSKLLLSLLSKSPVTAQGAACTAASIIREAVETEAELSMVGERLEMVIAAASSMKDEGIGSESGSGNTYQHVLTALGEV